MIRLLVWNIEFFTLKKINNPALVDTVEARQKQQLAEANLGFIRDTVKAANPDVFVVLEVRSEKGNLGELAGEGNGPQGLLRLLDELRTLNDDWYLVPPLKANPDILDAATYTETMGVFWRNTQVKFRGPYVWPQGPDGKPSPTGPSIDPKSGGKVAATYPGDWTKAMPAAADEAYWAAWIDLVAKDDRSRGIGAEPIPRQPYITDFLDRDGRKIRLLSVHLPPKHVTARERLMQYVGLKEVWLQDPLDVGVIAGDMNFDICTLDMAVTSYLMEFQNQYFPIRTLYPARDSAVPPSILKPVGEATLGDYRRWHCYDFGLARYYKQPPPRRNCSAVMIDPVFGVGDVAAAGEPPLQRFDSSMQQRPAELASKPPLEAARLFLEPQNYGRIRATSNHTPVLMTV